MARQRGLSEHQEQDQSQIIRDTRTFSAKFADFLKNPQWVAFAFIFLMLVVWIFPVVADLIFLFSFCMFIYTMTRRPRLPFRLPLRSKLKDPNDLYPGVKRKEYTARGIYFFGNEKDTGEELWFSNEDMRTHVLIFGSTGSGKTEGLISLSYNALIQSSGFIYVDGKGDNGLYAKIFSMVRSMGREDDLLLINFMTGARDIIGPQKSRLSNTMNPFSFGSSSMVSQLVVSLMDGSSSSSDGDMWKGRAIGFVEALMKILVVMRDAGHILLDANTIRGYFHLERLESIVIDRLFPRDGQEPVKLAGYPETVIEPIANYLMTLPGYNKAKKGKQVSQVLEQHGFITMQLTRVFTSLADTYGHIMRTKLAEVDLKDVVLNRRILVVLLPALEKSPDELSNLGKVVIASMKAMMAAGLGDAVEGDYADLVQRKPTHSKTPYLCILDEYGYYAVEGFAVVPAQARSLGFSVVFAGQDLPAFQKASKEEAASIGANTNIKICMKLEDPVETWDFFMKTAGESYVAHVESFAARPESSLNNYRDNASARLEKRARVDLLDLKNQGLGEAHMFFKSKLVRMSFFFADPKPVKTLRINHFLKVDWPLDKDIDQLKGAFDHFQQLINEEVGVDVVLDEELKKIDQFMVMNLPSDDPLDCAMQGLSYFSSEQVLSSVGVNHEAPLVEVQPGHINIYMPTRETEYLKKYVQHDDIASYFSDPLLNQSATLEAIEYIERLMGKSSQESMALARDFVADIQKRTDYPPEVGNLWTGAQFKSTVKTLMDDLRIRAQSE